jgi:hypothetical protein
MDAKKLLSGVFVILTLTFASLALGEYHQINTLNSQLRQVRSTPAQTVTSVTTVTSMALPI